MCLLLLETKRGLDKTQKRFDAQVHAVVGYDEPEAYHIHVYAVSYTRSRRPAPRKRQNRTPSVDPGVILDQEAKLSQAVQHDMFTRRDSNGVQLFLGALRSFRASWGPVHPGFEWFAPEAGLRS